MMTGNNEPRATQFLWIDESTLLSEETEQTFKRAGYLIGEIRELRADAHEKNHELDLLIEDLHRMFAGAR